MGKGHPDLQRLMYVGFEQLVSIDVYPWGSSKHKGGEVGDVEFSQPIYLPLRGRINHKPAPLLLPVFDNNLSYYEKFIATRKARGLSGGILRLDKIGISPPLPYTNLFEAQITLLSVALYTAYKWKLQTNQNITNSG
jgi:hypothetical protein